MSKYTKKILEPIIKNSRSFAQVLKKLNLKQGGGTQAHIKQKCIEFNIKTNHFLGMGWNVLGEPDFAKGKESIIGYFDKYTKRKPYNVKLRLLNHNLKKNECEKCGIKSNKGWNNQDITIELHHIDGDRKNNSFSNLQMLCPNCHSQTHNYKNRKKTKK
jgi:Zn finger protein HypA/HybF involved in hydrogenase expression